MRRRTIMLLAIGLSTLALPASALAPPPDLVLIHGFDEQNNLLVFGTSGVDETDGGCELGAGTYDYQIDDESNPADEDDPCPIQTVDVAGPNGQVNHGQVVRSFVHAIGELGLLGRGCVARVIAQSHYGKGDQQIRTSEVEQTDGANALPDGGSVVLETALAACSRSARTSDQAETMDQADERTNNGNGHGNGRPENPGNSGNNGENGKNGNNGNSGNNGRGQGKR